jgi:hypothetical protein
MRGCSCPCAIDLISARVVFDGLVTALLHGAVVLGFPAFAVWAVRTGGRRRLWLVAGGCLAGASALALVAASARFGNRLAAQQGYGRTALLIVLMAALRLGLPILASTLSVQATRGRIRNSTLLYLLGAAVAFVALMLGTGLSVYLLPAVV